jgi:MoxR-like ATPase
VDTIKLSPVMDGAETLALQRAVREIPAAEPALRYASSLVEATRPDHPTAPKLIRQYVRWGAGPRAGQALILGAKAYALLNGRTNIAPSDIQRVLHPVLRHRILPNFAAEAEGITVELLINDLLNSIQAPTSGIRS